jgi:hypothetical protein
MSLQNLKTQFDKLLSNLNASGTLNFASTVEAGFEALTLAEVMNEYKKVYGNILRVTNPASNKFLNQSPGRFRVERSFKIEFSSGLVFYFAADIEVFGLGALREDKPLGILFEADVVVLSEEHIQDILHNFRGFPAPQHIDSAYECKFGQYNKGQLRELLGLRRHLSYLSPSNSTATLLFNEWVRHSNPPIALKMVRPRTHIFYDIQTAKLYDLEQIIV